MTSELDHLTEEERKIVLSIFPKEIPDLESTDEGVKEDGEPVIKPEVDTSKVLDKRSEDQKQDWRSGYTDYEKKTKDSDRVVFEENEIEITEEDLE